MAEEAVLKAFLSGQVCALIAAFLNPFDVIKIRLQNQTPTSPTQYRGFSNGLLQIYREEGLRGWCRGLEASLLREMTYSSIRIGAYEPIRNTISGGSPPEDTSYTTKFLSALISGGTGSAIANPLDLVKTRSQATFPLPNKPHLYRHIVHAFATIYTTEGGLGALYRGWMVTSFRSAVLTSAQLGSYDSIKNNILRKQCHLDDGLLLHSSSAMLSGIITTTMANPVDVIKSRYLSDGMNSSDGNVSTNGSSSASGSRGGKIYKSPLDCVVQTYRRDGPLAFLRGWWPAYCRLGPHTFLSLIMIEKARQLLGLSTI